MLQSNFFSKYALLFPLFCGLFFSFNNAIFAQQQGIKMFIPAKKLLNIKNMSGVNKILGLLPEAEIQSFELTLFKPDSDPITYGNHSPQLQDITQTMLQEATIGYVYYFDNVVLKDGKETYKISAKYTVVEMEKGILQKVDARKLQNMHNNADIIAILDLPADTEIERFELTYHKPDHDPITVISPYSQAVSSLFAKAVAGDTYYFDQMVIKNGETTQYMSAVCKVVE